MGRKYAVILIHNIPSIATTQEVSALYGGHEETADEWVQRQLAMYRKAEAVMKRQGIATVLKEADYEAKLRQYALNYRTPNPYIAVTGRFWRIYDYELSFETVVDEAMRLSNAMPNAVGYMSIFDDDVFLFGIFEAGKQTVRYAFGEGLLAYSIKCEKIQGERLKQLFEFVDTKYIDDLNNAEDVIDAEIAVSNLLQIDPFS